MVLKEPDAAQTSGPGNPPSQEPEASPLSVSKDVTTSTDQEPGEKYEGEYTLSLSQPAHLSAITLPGEDGEEAVTIDRKGLDVPGDKVAEYKKRAKASGVTLTSKKKG